MASASTQVWASVALWAFFFLVACQGVVARIWPGAITGGLKILLALAIAPVLLGLLGEKAEKKKSDELVLRPSAKAPAPRAAMDRRPGVFASTSCDQRDTLWIRLAPNEEYTARDALTGRATGVYARRPIAHDVDDSPRRPWIPASFNMIRPFRDWDFPWYGKTVGVRYGDRASKTGHFT